MESIYPDDTPLAAYLEGENWEHRASLFINNMLTVTGQGIADDAFNYQNDHIRSSSSSESATSDLPGFAPHMIATGSNVRLKRFRQSLQLRIPKKGTISNAHAAWSVR